MQLPTTTDTHSPWYEAFAPQAAPMAWVVAAPEAAAPATVEPEQAEDRWTTEALFDYYNE